MSPWIAGAEIKGVVFIDSMVPDLQALLGGLAPGERAFVLDTSQGGLEQVAAILAANNLTDFGSIAIVGHGASGSINVGTTTLNDADLAAHAAALKAIGAAVAPGGALDLYSCDTASGPQGRAFVADLAKAAGVTVDASTKEIGRTATGENWALDATSPGHFGLQAAAMPAAYTAQTQSASTSSSVADAPSAAGPRDDSVASSGSPFTAAAMQSYQGTLAASSGTVGQLFGIGPNNAGVVQSYYLNSNGASLGTISSTGGGSNAIAVDPVLGAIFELKTYNQPNVGDFHDTLYIGSLAAGAAAPVMSASFEQYYEANFDSETLNDTTDTGDSIAVDAADHLLFIPIGSDNTAHNGLLEMSYSADTSGTVTVNESSIRFLETSTGNEPPSYFSNGAVYDYATKNVYIDDVLDGSTSNEENGIYRISSTAGGTSGQPVALYNNAGGDRIYGLALDAKDDRLFFATTTATSSTTNRNALYVLENPDTASNAMPIALTYAPGVTAPTYGAIEGVAYDDNANVLYVSNDYIADANQTNYNYQRSEIDRLQLNSTGTQVTAVTAIPYTTLSSTQPGEPPFSYLTYDPLSTLTAVGTTTAVSKTTPLTLLASAPSITDYSSGGFLQSATVAIADATSGAVVSGDTLDLVKGGTFTTFTSTPATYVDNGHTFNVSYANGVLTIANQPGSAATGQNSENTIASFQQVLADVQYRNNSTDTNNRTATFQVNNGAIGNPSGSVNAQSLVVTVDKPPAVVAGGYKVPSDVQSGASTTVAAAGTATAPTGGALAGDTSPANSGNLSITAVQTSGGTAGSVGSALSGTYGSLTLQSTGAYSYAAGNTTAIADAKTGSHPVDSYSFTVSNAGGTTPETFTATIDRAPIGTADAATATELGPAVTGTVLTNDSDPDGDKLTVASVSFNGTAGTLGQSVTGTYGSLTLNADGSYSYTANNPVVYATNSPPRTDTFDYTDSDGLGGTSAPTALTFTVTCFATGTRIRVARGEGVEDAPVEALRVGDLAVTASGARRPIRWIGHRDVDCAAVPPPHDVRPVRIREGAFGVGADGAGVPERELRLSPGHPVLVGTGPHEILVPIMCLINGTSVARTADKTVTYWHIELDAHDILLAEGLPAESYLDWGDRAFFGADAEAHALADPDFVVPGLAGRCRPVALDGPAVAAERRRLEAIFAMQLDAMGHWPDPDADVGSLV